MFYAAKLVLLIIGFICYLTAALCKHYLCCIKQLFAWLGFAVAIVWIYSLANEIVSILQVYTMQCGDYSSFLLPVLIPKALGVIIDLTDAVLGLTLLAWGNSIGGTSLITTSLIFVVMIV